MVTLLAVKSHQDYLRLRFLVFLPFFKTIIIDSGTAVSQSHLVVEPFLI